MSKEVKKIKYSKMNQREHVLKRPDMYVGSVRLQEKEEYVSSLQDISSLDEIFIEKKEVSLIPGLLRIFIEGLSNVIDNKWRSEDAGIKCDKIIVNINKETGETSIWNDGLCPPIEIDSKEKIYTPELIFGNLLAGSNFDDEEKRKTSGRNGLGITLANIFSTIFTVKIIDSLNRKEYTQIFRKNLSLKEDPEIKKTTSKTSSVEVKWIPDFKYFNLEGYTDDILNVYERYIIDMAMITGIPVYYNNNKIHIKSLLDYSKLFLIPEKRDTKEILYIKTKDSEVVVSACEKKSHGFVSFVNGVHTAKGGIHVDAWSEAFFRPIINKINSPKRPQINIKDIRPFFRIFVSCILDNPEFDSQSKETLTEPKKINTEVLPKYINTIMKWSFRDKIEEIIKGKEFLLLKKGEKKGKSFKQILGFDPANNAGGKNKNKCVLIVCEGLSAKTFAVTGLPIGIKFENENEVLEGRDWFGIYPLRGKLLNVRNATTEQISKNREITDIIRILGIQHGEDYTDDDIFNKLNYGKLLILTDADEDGAHIKGLLINFIHSLFPSLIERNNFIISMQTPVAKIFIKNKTLTFYDTEEYNKAKEENKDVKYTAKHYKGLGTSTDKEIKEFFGKQMIKYVNSETSDETINKAFHSKLTDERKEWMKEFDPFVKSKLKKINNNFLEMDFSDFIDKELILFSIEDCKRNIPCIVDGLKVSQRKVLYSCFLKKLNHNRPSIKVAQLAGFIAEKTSYHHGEQCLFDTIIKMACAFVGSNNVPLLVDEGQFGSRTQNGKDAASPRYIFTKLREMTRLIFKEEDDCLLSYLEDDGVKIEPDFFVPIIPMVLANGCEAIGTGWSTSIPCYNPEDIIESIKFWLDNKGYSEELYEVSDDMIISSIPEIDPWYRNFKGKIEKTSDKKYISYGNYTSSKEVKNTIIEVTEIPIGISVDKYKENLEVLLEQSNIKDLKNYSTKNRPVFKITQSQNSKVDHKAFKLSSIISTTNMVLFSSENKIKKYSCTEEIINEFCKIRYKFYILRKQNIIRELEKSILINKNKKRFLEEVMGKILIIENRDEKELVKEMEEKGYYSYVEEADNLEEDEENKKSKSTRKYAYLLSMQVRSFTKQKLEELYNKIKILEEELEKIKNISESEMWIKDLDEFLVEYKKFEKVKEKELEEEKNKKSK